MDLERDLAKLAPNYTVGQHKHGRTYTTLGGVLVMNYYNRNVFVTGDAPAATELIHGLVRRNQRRLALLKFENGGLWPVKRPTGRR
jgi:hypothetical protein